MTPCHFDLTEAKIARVTMAGLTLYYEAYKADGQVIAKRETRYKLAGYLRRNGFKIVYQFTESE